MTNPDRWPSWAIPGLLGAFAVAQAAAWILADGVPTRTVDLLQLLVSWIAIVLLAYVATRRIGRLASRLTEKENAHLAALDAVEQLLTQNAILEIIARSVDVPLAFQSLATRIVRLVPCDRVGLALLQNDREFQTYTARVREEERRARPRPEVVFKTERTIIGSVVQSREPLIINDTAECAPDYLDVNVLHSAGFRSALVMPLVSKGRAVGTLNVVSRRAGAFGPLHIPVLEPIAEIFAVAYVAHQLQAGLSKYQMMESMSELTLATAAEINSALQTIMGHCDLIERGYPDPALQRDLATIARQAERIASLLENMRTLAKERMRELAEAVAQEGRESSLEAYADRE